MVSLYSCGLRVLGAQGLAVRSMHCIYPLTFGFYHAFGGSVIKMLCLLNVGLQVGLQVGF